MLKTHSTKQCSLVSNHMITYPDKLLIKLCHQETNIVQRICYRVTTLNIVCICNHVKKNPELIKHLSKLFLLLSRVLFNMFKSPSDLITLYSKIHCPLFREMHLLQLLYI